MSKPRPLGNLAISVISEATDKVADNQRALFDVVVLIYAGDKDSAARALQAVSNNNTVVLQVLTLLRAGELHEAQNVLLDAGSRSR